MKNDYCKRLAPLLLAALCVFSLVTSNAFATNVSARCSKALKWTAKSSRSAENTRYYQTKRKRAWAKIKENQTSYKKWKSQRANYYSKLKSASSRGAKINYLKEMNQRTAYLRTMSSMLITNYKVYGKAVNSTRNVVNGWYKSANSHSTRHACQDSATGYNAYLSKLRNLSNKQVELAQNNEKRKSTMIKNKAVWDKRYEKERSALAKAR